MGPLLVSLQATIASDRQVSLEKLLLNHLPAADGHLLVDGGDAAVVQLDVAELLKLIALRQDLGQALRLGLLGGQGEDVLDGAGGAELGVGDEVAGELV